MQLFLLFCLSTLAASFILPLTPGTPRCMVVYSLSQEDTIKITIAVPQDQLISQSYTFVSSLQHLNQSVISEHTITPPLFKMEITVPNSTPRTIQTPYTKTASGS